MFRVLFHDSTLVCSTDCRNGHRSNTHFVVIMAEIEHVNVSNKEFLEEVARYECVYHRNSKDFKANKLKTSCWDKIGQNRFMTNRKSKFACSKISSSTFDMLFALQPTRACIFDITADRVVWPRSALRSLRSYRNCLFCDRLRLFAICDL